jgi:hypothetical protein
MKTFNLNDKNYETKFNVKENSLSNKNLSENTNEISPADLANKVGEVADAAKKKAKQLAGKVSKTLEGFGSGKKELGQYGGECLKKSDGYTCLDDQTRCAEVKLKQKCWIKSWHRCDKNKENICADDKFVCINYRVKDSTGTQVALCSIKGTYLDSCSSTNPCAEDFQCTDIMIKTTIEKLCLVKEGSNCKATKFCQKGNVCNQDDKCDKCKNNTVTRAYFKYESGFLHYLNIGINCEQLQDGVLDKYVTDPKSGKSIKE